MMVSQILTQIARGVLDLSFPWVCANCGDGSDDGLLCDSCKQVLLKTAATAACRRCAATVGPFALREQGCDLCHKKRFAFDRVIRLGRYDSELRYACLRLKELSGYHLGHALGRLLWQTQGRALTLEEPDVVAPIPLSTWRRFRRGYNQVHPIAHGLASELRAPLQNDLLIRTRSTAKQFQLSPTEREKNLQNAFRCRNGVALQGKTVLLVDDILTTGATCHQASRALKKAGAARVVVAVLARGDHVSGR